MARRNYIPESQPGFNMWSGNFMKNLGEIYSESIIPLPVYNNLVVMWEDYEKKYSVSENLETRTTIAIFLRNVARKSFEKEIRRIVKAYIINNPEVSENQLKLLDLPIHKKTRSKREAPYTRVTMIIRALDSLRLIIQFHNQELLSLEDSRKRRRPYGCIGAIIASAVLTSPPDSVNELTNQVLATRTPHILSFKSGQSGMKAYIAICWINEKGQIGPWSDIQVVTIP
jgi:hypothetical protein